MSEPIVLTGIAATWDGYELDFTMSMGGLLELASYFREFSCGMYQLGHERVGIGSSVGVLEIRHGEGKLKVSVEHDRVSFVGNAEAMSLLAENMAGLLSLWAAGGTQHFHFDPSSDRMLLEPDSEAFILSPQQ